MRLNILLVEDNSTDASVLKEFIDNEKNGPKMHWVKDGGHAIDYVYQQGLFMDAVPPNIILLDLALPYVDGIKVLKELKLHPSYSDIPIIVLTTSDSPVDRENCFMLGASAYFSKPSNLQGYMELVHTLIHFEFPRLASVHGNNPPLQ